MSRLISELRRGWVLHRVGYGQRQVLGSPRRAVESVVSLAEFCAELVEFGSKSESRWDVCSKRSVCYPRVGF